MLPLDLPTIQNWSCHNCGGCCRQHAIAISAEEHERIAAQGWTAADGIPQDQPLFERIGLFPWSKWHRLAHQHDGACVFLNEQGLCRIHAKFGEDAKPLACRIYPYAFHPAGKKIAVSLRFSCPSVASNQGKGVAAQRNDLVALERLVVPDQAPSLPPPDISPGQRLDWPDTLKVVEQLDEVFAGEAVSVTLQLLHALKLIELIGQSRFEKIRGPRLDDFLEIVSTASRDEIANAPGANDSGALPEPSRPGRMQFRMLCAQYARRDMAGQRNSLWKTRWKLFWMALRFTRGTGLVPAVQPAFTEVPFTDLERPFGPLPAEASDMLIRYLRVKIQGLHFCGPAYYNVPLVEGFQSLALVVPVVLWLARWLAAGSGRTRLEADDVSKALSIADHHHGYSPAFGQSGFRGRVRFLARLDDISKLVTWYS